jgi:hypothetical protein
LSRHQRLRTRESLGPRWHTFALGPVFTLLEFKVLSLNSSAPTQKDDDVFIIGLFLEFDRRNLSAAAVNKGVFTPGAYLVVYEDRAPLAAMILVQSAMPARFSIIRSFGVNPLLLSPHLVCRFSTLARQQNESKPFSPKILISHYSALFLPAQTCSECIHYTYPRPHHEPHVTTHILSLHLHDFLHVITHTTYNPPTIIVQPLGIRRLFISSIACFLSCRCCCFPFSLV